MARLLQLAAAAALAASLFLGAEASRPGAAVHKTASAPCQGLCHLSIF